MSGLTKIESGLGKNDFIAYPTEDLVEGMKTVEGEVLVEEEEDWSDEEGWDESEWDESEWDESGMDESAWDDYDWEEEDADWSYESEGEWEDVDEGGYVWEGGRTEGGGAEG